MSKLFLDRPYGFVQRKLNRIYAGTIAENYKSVRLLERLGFVREGTRRQHSLEDDGRFLDSAMYGLIRSDWGYDRLSVQDLVPGGQ